MMRLLPSCAIVAGMLLAPMAYGQNIRPLDGERSFKGWELYSWQDGAAWRFSLLYGTNRLKFCAEVKNPKGALDLAGAENALGRIAEIEFVSWIAPAERVPQDTCPLALPPADMAERLWQVCQRRNLHCQGWAGRTP